MVTGHEFGINFALDGFRQIIDISLDKNIALVLSVLTYVIDMSLINIALIVTYMSWRNRFARARNERDAISGDCGWRRRGRGRALTRGFG
jgi:hypothetical protein